MSRTELPDWRQAAYELEIEPSWSSGRVDSAESVLVPWGAPPLTSRERRTVRVRVWGEGDAEPSAWSEDVVVEAGLLEPADWTAQLVQPLLPEPGRHGRAGRRCCAASSSLDKPVVRARLYATAHGVYEAEIDGAAVGDHVLAPGLDQLPPPAALPDLRRHRPARRRARTRSACTLADGWYRGHLGFTGGAAAVRRPHRRLRAAGGRAPGRHAARS